MLIKSLSSFVQLYLCIYGKKLILLLLLEVGLLWNFYPNSLLDFLRGLFQKSLVMQLKTELLLRVQTCSSTFLLLNALGICFLSFDYLGMVISLITRICSCKNFFSRYVHSSLLALCLLWHLALSLFSLGSMLRRYLLPSWWFFKKCGWTDKLIVLEVM